MGVAITFDGRVDKAPCVGNFFGILRRNGDALAVYHPDTVVITGRNKHHFVSVSIKLIFFRAIANRLLGNLLTFENVCRLLDQLDRSFQRPDGLLIFYFVKQERRSVLGFRTWFIACLRLKKSWKRKANIFEENYWINCFIL